MIFAAGGAFIASETAVPLFVDWQAMQGWQAHTAVLQSVSGGDSSTEATYRYEWHGRTFQNDRVHVAAFNDNIGSYQRKLQDRLDKLYRNKQPVTIYVDPTDPRQSVIDRDMRWGLAVLVTGFCAIFLLIGVVVIYASLSPSRSPKFKAPKIADLRREFELKQKDESFNQSFLEFLQQILLEHVVGGV